MEEGEEEKKKRRGKRRGRQSFVASSDKSSRTPDFVCSIVSSMNLTRDFTKEIGERKDGEGRKERGGGREKKKSTNWTLLVF